MHSYYEFERFHYSFKIFFQCTCIAFVGASTNAIHAFEHEIHLKEIIIMLYVTLFYITISNHN